MNEPQVTDGDLVESLCDWLATEHHIECDNIRKQQLEWLCRQYRAQIVAEHEQVMAKIKLGTFGVLMRDGKTLLGKRAANDSSFPGCWGHPGGGIEFKESSETALKREFLEEVGLSVSVLPGEQIFQYITDKRHVVLIFKRVTSDGIPTPCDGFEEVRWFTYDEVVELAKQGLTTPSTLWAFEAFNEVKLNTLREALLAAEKELKFAHENWSDMFHDAVSSCRICKALTLIHAAFNTEKKGCK